MKRFFLKYYLLSASLFLLTFTACNDDDPFVEPPTIMVTPETTNADIGSIIDFTIDVTAGAGLSAVKLNGADIQSFNGQTEDVFTYSYTMPAAEDQQLTFTVEAADNTSESVTVSVTFLSTTFTLGALEDAGTFSVVQKRDSWEADPSDKNAWTLDGGDQGESTLIWVRDAGAGFAEPWEFGATAPDGSKSLMITRSKPELSGWAGWMTSFFDFGSGNYLPVEEIEAIQTGSRVIALDVYFEELDATHTFATMSAWENNNADNVKVAGGIKFQIRLGTEALFGSVGENTADKQWLNLGIKEAYLTKAGEWQTLYFVDNDPGEATLRVDQTRANEIDRIFFVPNYAYPEIETNKMYLRNLRIVNKP